MKKIVIIGAGPIGIEAAIYAKKSGFSVKILESENIANNISKWQHVTLFSPFHMNSTSLGIKTLKENGIPTIANDSYHTAQEYTNKYLLPLASRIKEDILTNCHVTAISKKKYLKGEMIGNKARSETPFIIEYQSSDETNYLEADYVIDTSGVYTKHRNIGFGGLKAQGEINLKKQISYYIPDIEGKDKNDYLGKKTLLIGSGYSAATSVKAFKSLFAENTATELIWLIRKDTSPYIVIENDALSLRKELVETVNQMIEHPQIKFYNSSQVESFEKLENGKIKVRFLQNNEPVEAIVDNIIANVGYKPDNSLYEELQVHECYASQGPMKLAATLLGDSSGDCLNQTSKGADTLKNPEPDFYIIGSKSYGRNSSFLLRLGYEQIKEIFTLITDNKNHDLYE